MEPFQLRVQDQQFLDFLVLLQHYDCLHFLVPQLLGQLHDVHQLVAGIVLYEQVPENDGLVTEAEVVAEVAVAEVVCYQVLIEDLQKLVFCTSFIQRLLYCIFRKGEGKTMENKIIHKFKRQ